MFQNIKTQTLELLKKNMLVFIIKIKIYVVLITSNRIICEDRAINTMAAELYTHNVQVKFLFLATGGRKIRSNWNRLH